MRANEDCGHERAATPLGAYRPGLDTWRSRRHYMSSLNNLDVTPAVIGGAWIDCEPPPNWLAMTSGSSYRLPCLYPDMAELQQLAERRELGDDLHACCARQYAEYERKSDARCNAQHWGRSISPMWVGGALQDGRISWGEEGERGCCWASNTVWTYRVSLKKGTFSDFRLISVKEHGFYIFTCVL